MDERLDVKANLGLLAAGLLLAVPAAADTGPAGSAWNWDAFPTASTLLVAQLPASVVAIRSEVVRAPASGRLRLLPLARQAGPIAIGAAWAVINPEAEPAESREVAREDSDLAARRARYREVELPAALEKMDAALAAERETLAMARFAERSPDLFAGTTPVLDPRLKPSATAAQVEIRIRALEERRKEAAASDPSADPPDLQAMASTLDAHRRILAEKLAPRPITAPIAGTLRLAVSPETDGLRVEAGAFLATLSDDASLEVVVPGSLPLLHAVPADSLYCTVTAAGGAAATATFSSWGVETSGSGLRPVIRFRLPAEAFEGRRADLAGIEVPSLVYTRLPEAARIVPKLVLAAWDSDGLLTAGWGPGLIRLFPGSRLLAEGRSSVAVAPPR